MTNETKKVKCPKCHKEFVYKESKFRPFCGEKCKMVDLGHWLMEGYRVPGENVCNQEIFDEENESEQE